MRGDTKSVSNAAGASSTTPTTGPRLPSARQAQSVAQAVDQTVETATDTEPDPEMAPGIDTTMSGMDWHNGFAAQDRFDQDYSFAVEGPVGPRGANKRKASATPSVSFQNSRIQQRISLLTRSLSFSSLLHQRRKLQLHLPPKV